MKPKIAIQMCLHAIFICLLTYNCADINKLLIRGEFRKAKDHCGRKRKSERTLCYDKVAHAYLTKGDYEEAATWYDIANGWKKYYLNKGDSLSMIGGYNTLGNNSLEKKEYGKAMKYFIEGDDTVGLYKVADIFFSQNQGHRALPIYKRLNDTAGLYRVAEILVSQKKYYQAISVYEMLNDEEMIDKSKMLIASMAGTWKGSGWYYRDTSRAIEGRKSKIEEGSITFTISEDGKTVTELILNLPCDEPKNKRFRYTNTSIIDGHFEITREGVEGISFEGDFSSSTEASGKASFNERIVPVYSDYSVSSPSYAGITRYSVDREVAYNNCFMHWSAAPVAPIGLKTKSEQANLEADEECRQGLEKNNRLLEKKNKVPVPDLLPKLEDNETKYQIGANTTITINSGKEISGILIDENESRYILDISGNRISIFKNVIKEIHQGVQ